MASRRKSTACTLRTWPRGARCSPGRWSWCGTFPGAYQLYIVTNGNAVSQMSRLERSGLLPYVQDVFVSEDAGAAKPDVRYFDYAFSRIPGFEKERALLIGDSLTSDMLGAQNTGHRLRVVLPPGRGGPRGPFHHLPGGEL